MSKAEERALEKYPLMADDDKEGLEALKYIGMECECAAVYNEVQESKQAYYIEGYHQAEKDLELAWKDMEQIYNICCEVFLDYEVTRTNMQKIWKEVLKRFKEQKEELL